MANQIAAMTRTSLYEQIGTIGHVTVLAQSSLQTSATINESVPASRLQTEDYMRAGDALISLPGVTTQTSSSLGDDMSISIRGFDSSETATLLDGHPIGPIGAFGGGFDYQVSPFFGLRDIETVFGSGATTIYGASTIAGAVDMQTINPTQQQHLLVEQGFGSDGKLLTGLQATGTDQKLGYALSHAVEGTDGLFPSSTIEQSGVLGTVIMPASAKQLLMAGITSARDLGAQAIPARVRLEDAGRGVNLCERLNHPAALAHPSVDPAQERTDPDRVETEHRDNRPTNHDPKE